MTKPPANATSSRGQVADAVGPTWTSPLVRAVVEVGCVAGRPLRQ